jgi:G-patch domain
MQNRDEYRAPEQPLEPPAPPMSLRQLPAKPETIADNKVYDIEVPTSSTISLPKSNLGYKLLEKAGWSGHGGIGAQEQGRIEPIQPDIRQGNIGLGFESKKKKISKNILLPKDRGGMAEKAKAKGVGSSKSKNNRKVSALLRDELADEDIDTKVKRVKQIMQTEADEKAGKELARLVYSAFRDGGGDGGGGGGTTDVNPLLRKNKKLSARNPLL